MKYDHATVRQPTREKIINDELLDDEDAQEIIESVLDTLIEVGNGVTDHHLHEACDQLFALRDKWFKQKCKEIYE